MICDYCGRQTDKVTGADIYPHRPDLKSKVIYRCVPCKAHVGCHPGTDRPLGRLANADLRKAKMAAHAAFDPSARAEAYQWLAEALGISRDDCHIGMFDVETCKRVVLLCRDQAREERG